MKNPAQNKLPNLPSSETRPFCARPPPPRCPPTPPGPARPNCPSASPPEDHGVSKDVQEQLLLWPSPEAVPEKLKSRKSLNTEDRTAPLPSQGPPTAPCLASHTPGRPPPQGSRLCCSSATNTSMPDAAKQIENSSEIIRFKAGEDWIFRKLLVSLKHKAQIWFVGH